jgi:hypothetical protein
MDDTSFLSGIYDAMRSVSAWVGVLSGGVILTYYVLPHMSGKIYANAITFVWVSALLAVWAFVLQPILDPLVIIVQYFMSYVIYPIVPHAMVQSINDTIFSLIAAWFIKIAFFPERHHSKV